MDKIGPVELEFTIGKQAQEDARGLKKSIDEIGPSSARSAAELKKAIELQSNEIKRVEKDIANLTAKAEKMAPGKVHRDMIYEINAAKKALDHEKAALSDLEKGLDKTKAATLGLLTQKRQLTEQLVAMEMAGKRGTAEYDALAKKLGDLTDRMTDAATQARVLAYDNRGLQGVISGISGLSGAMSAGAGAVGLFAGENENLMKIQTRVQSLMAITIGLQQVLNVMNKDSAFRIVTVAQAKRLWGAAVEILNQKLRVNIALSKLMVGAGIGLVIAAVTALVVVYQKWKARQEEINKLKKEFNEIDAESVKNVAKEKVEINSLLKVANNYNANLETRNKAIEKLRRIMPEYNGYINSEGELIDNSTEAMKNYLTQMVKVERAKILMNKLAEAEARKDALNKGVGVRGASFWSQAVGFLNPAFITAQATSVANRFQKDSKLITNEIEAFQKALDEMLEDTSIFEALFGSSSDKEAYDAAAELRKKLLDIQEQTANLLFNQQVDNTQKRLDQVDREHAAELRKIEDFQRQVIEKYNEANKFKAGFAPLSTDTGRLQAGIGMIDPALAKKYEQELAKLAEVYTGIKLKINRDAAAEVKKIMLEITDAHQAEQEKELAAVVEKHEKIRQELIRLQGFLTATQEDAISASQARAEQVINDTWFLRTSDAFEKLFGNIDRMSTRVLEQSIATAKEILESKRGSLDPKDLETYVQAITRAENLVRQRNPFKSLLKDVKEYRQAANDTEKEDSLARVMESTVAWLTQVTTLIDTVVSGLEKMGLLNDNQIKMAHAISDAFKGASEIAMGIATQNPLAIVQGVMTLLNSGFSAIDKSIEKTSRQIAKLEQQYRRLQDATSKALGTDVFKSYQEEIKTLEKLMAKNIQFIGLEASKGGKKADQEAIDAAAESFMDAKARIEEIYAEIFELVTQTNAKTLADELASALVDAFQQGSDAAQVFEEVSTRVLQNAVKNALKMQLLEKPIQDAIKKLQQSMGSFDSQGVFQYDGLTENEAKAFKDQIAAIGKTYADALKDLGYLFGGPELEPDKSLTGSIKGVTEATASALGGQINAIRVNAAETKDIVRQQLLQLTQIEHNTRYNIHLLEIRDILKSMNVDNLRPQGL